MKKNADILVNTLDSFGVKTTMLDICRGPSVTRYELQPSGWYQGQPHHKPWR